MSHVLTDDVQSTQSLTSHSTQAPLLKLYPRAHDEQTPAASQERQFSSEHVASTQVLVLGSKI